MLQSLVRQVLHHRVVVVVLAALGLGYGLFVAQKVKLDVFPDFVQPQVVVQTECPGFPPEQVEALVTTPIERVVGGLGHLETLRSESVEGLSIITAVFAEGSDILSARQMLAERLGELGDQLPAGVKPPRMTPLTSSTMDLLKIGLTSDKLSPMELRTFADWTLKPRLLAIQGVAKCSIFGGEVRQLQIQIQPDRLQAHGLTIAEVVGAARSATGVMPAGFIETPNQRITLQSVGETPSLDALAATVVKRSGDVSVRLSDVARVVEAAAPTAGAALVQGRPGVLITMSSQLGANTMEVTRALEAALADMKPLFEQSGITLYPRLHRPATFIENALGNMRSSLMLGGVLIAVVLFSLLGSVRTAVISLVAIPLSLLTAVVVLDRLGVTINTMTLGGLAIALGEVVDDSIIDVENIFRRLRENRASAQPRPALAVVLDASLEVRRVVIFATCVVVLVFLPILTLTGLQGSFFAPLALSYILAVVASLAVALTVTPALSLLFFGGRRLRSAEPWLQARVKAGYRWLLRRVSAWPRLLIGLVALLCLAALGGLPLLGGDLLPTFREGHLVLQVNAAPGTSLDEMLRQGRAISQALLAHPGIATVEQQIGRAELGEDPWPTNQSEFHVELAPMSGADEARTVDEVRAILDGFPGLQTEVLTFLGDRIGETLSGETAPVVVNIFGEDLDLLDEKAREVAAVLQGVEGAADVAIKAPPGAPRLTIRPRPERMSELGFRPLEVLESVATAYQGLVVAQIHRGQVTTDVAVVLDPAVRRSPEGVGALLVTGSDGAAHRLDELADVFLTDGRHAITHEGARRRQTITCNPQGRDIAGFVEEARRAIHDRVAFPRGTYPEFSGAAQAQQRAQRELLLHVVVAAIGILLLLAVAFGNGRNLALVLSNVPFALVGGVGACVLMAWLGGEAGGGLTIGSLVGFVTLFGITTRNSLLMVSHFEHLVEQEGETWGLDAAVRGAGERVMPILMTAMVTGLALLPLALGSGEAGREIEGPMAIVILGGLLTSTALNLLVLPTLAVRYGRFGSRSTTPPTPDLD